MINFQEFQVTPFNQQSNNHYQANEVCEPMSFDQHLSVYQTDHSIHQVNIQEISDHFSSIQHSANILDGMDKRHKDFTFVDKSHTTCHHEENSEQSKLRKRLDRRLKNQTKNIPKNFGKGIISFIEKNDKKIKALISEYGIPYQEFIAQMKQEKRIINTIADLRRLWTDPKIGKCLRVISNLFFRRHALHYIFNSRISNYSSHIKYRQSLWQALQSPQSFNHIKQY